MMRSMTGFGRAEGVVKDRKVTVEVRSLNSKQLDLLLKVPGVIKEREGEIRPWLSEQLVRGKAEVYITAELLHAAKRTTFDKDLVRAYHDELRTIADEVFPDDRPDLLAHVLRMPDVMTTASERLDDEEWDGVRVLLQAAVRSFDDFRQSEGARLMDDLLARASRIGVLLNEAEALDTGRTERTRERLLAKLADLRVEVDADRFEQELVYYLEKLDINEEKVRLRSHLAYLVETMRGDEQQGRKLGFIGQEIGREINTIGSKANDAAIQRLVVLMKDELEKVKEQVMNIL